MTYIQLLLTCKDMRDDISDKYTLYERKMLLYIY